MPAIQRTKAPSVIDHSHHGKPAQSPPGLGNWDNSCYQNSVIQGLASLETLPAFLQYTTIEDTFSTVAALRMIMNRLNDPNNAGKTVWTPAELKSMSSWQQQDAQEYFSKTIDEVEKDIAKARRRQPRNDGLKELLAVDSATAGAETAESNYHARGSECGASREDTEINLLPNELASLVIRNPLEGLLAQRVGCQRCGFVEGLSLVPFNCLTLPIGPHSLYDMRTCLDDLTVLEPIDGVECVKCTLLQAQMQITHVLDRMQISQSYEQATNLESVALIDSLRSRLRLIGKAVDDRDFSDNVLKACQISNKNRVSTTKSRQAVVARAPKALTIHVNRSNFNEHTGEQSKNYAVVKFPMRLDLNPWCLGHSSGPIDSQSTIEKWNVNPKESMLVSTEENKNQSKRMYELRAVITHYGKHENGHYICYRRSPQLKGAIENSPTAEGSESWWRLSDEDVTEVDKDFVLGQGGVFMLFYEHLESLQTSEAVSPEQPSLSEATKNPEMICSVPMSEVSEDDNNLNIDKVINKARELPFDERDDNERTTEAMRPNSKGSTSQVIADSDDPAHETSTFATKSDTRPDSSPTAINGKEEPVQGRMTEPQAKTSHLSPAVRPLDRQPALSELSRTSSQKENMPSEPASNSVRVDEQKCVAPTISPRTGRGVNKAGKAMESVAGFVQAN